MSQVDLAGDALSRAEKSQDVVERTVWLAKAADYAIERRAILVGGAAVNLYTGSYRPTDVDLCAYLDEMDRESMKSVGFQQIQGDHFSYTFHDGERWLIEFPDSQVDGDVSEVDLGSGASLGVVSIESLVVDRVLQATDGSGVTRDEALRLIAGAYYDVRWELVESEIDRRDLLQPMLRIRDCFLALSYEVRRLLNENDADET